MWNVFSLQTNTLYNIIVACSVWELRVPDIDRNILERVIYEESERSVEILLFKHFVMNGNTIAHQVDIVNNNACECSLSLSLFDSVFSFSVHNFMISLTFQISTKIRVAEILACEQRSTGFVAHNSSKRIDISSSSSVGFHRLVYISLLSRSYRTSLIDEWSKWTSNS